MKLKEKAYHYRGMIERLYTRGCAWLEGYSQGTQSEVYYPWMPRRHCKTEAKRDGYKAVFYRDGKREKGQGS